MRVLQPIAVRGIEALARRRVDPRWVVASHGLAGLAAAWALARGGTGGLLAAAALLLLKTLLDNIDGGLARATGRVTQAGRYLDTLTDLVVNAALFAALARFVGGAVAWPAFALLTLLLSLDYNLEARHLQAAGAPPPVAGAPGGPPWLLRALRAAYAALLGWQDLALRAGDEALLRRLAGPAYGAHAVRAAWSDRFSTAMLVDLGLSTQLIALAVCAALGHPGWYAWSLYGQAAYALALQGVRVARFRRRLRGSSPHPA